MLELVRTLLLCGFVGSDDRSDHCVRKYQDVCRVSE